MPGRTPGAPLRFSRRFFKPNNMKPKSLTSLLRIVAPALLATALCLPATAQTVHPKAAPVQLKRIGKVTPRASVEGVSPRIGIGFEKLDRNVFDPEKAYDKVGALGVKWVRIQSGWQRTEKVRGQYDFAWLDSVVDNLIKRGMTPWINLCYGNELYTPEAKKYYGAVGVPPVKTEEERRAWAAYVTAVVKHFKGRVQLYEIWNEPNALNCWKTGVNPAEYGEFVIATSKAIRAVDPSAQIAGGVTSGSLKHLGYMAAALETGMAAHLDIFSYHYYAITELGYKNRYDAMRTLVRAHNPNIKMVQGESGTQSRPDGRGALRYRAWTPQNQAKLLLRHLVTDISFDVDFTSYFTTVDMIEALDGKVGEKASYLDYGYFGVLGADFDEDGRSTGEYTPKPSYYALQNLCSVFTDDVTTGNIALQIVPGEGAYGKEVGFDDHPLQYLALEKSNGARGFLYWNATDLLTTSFESATTMIFTGLPKPVRLVDLITGDVYEVPDEMLVRSRYKGNSWTLKNIRITDYPLLLTFGDFVKFEPTKK
ncbi:hypothetical protein CKA38_14885 [Ereboglobus luteus]|uniref:Glycosyl hydrolases family 39 N-terminal catalytic domain-containing protein n=2 Tax=Ereboglobus luteus TaxID=1796921 RepID=A0A2U8E6C4_9BACT|nr:hypothetical protein CKA38_14885 [Ereboglobus luteus]